MKKDRFFEYEVSNEQFSYGCYSGSPSQCPAWVVEGLPID
jgi:hypothetical protein